MLLESFLVEGSLLAALSGTLKDSRVEGWLWLALDGWLWLWLSG